MPQRDMDHDLVKNALIKDGWSITHDPLRLEFGGIDFFIDLGAEQLIAAEKGMRKIAVEIKGCWWHFDGERVSYPPGSVYELPITFRQRSAGSCSVSCGPDNVFDDFFELPFGRLAIDGHRLKILVYDPENEEIAKWID